jgi:hypothetical protein
MRHRECMSVFCESIILFFIVVLIVVVFNGDDDDDERAWGVDVSRSICTSLDMRSGH